MKHGRKNLLSKALFWLLSALIAFYIIVPFYWAINSSLKTDSQLSMMPTTFVPRAVDTGRLKPTFQNYVVALHHPGFWKGLRNSFIVATSTTLLSLALGVMSAFALAKIPFRGKTAVRYLILSMTMFPQIAVLAGLYALIRLFDLPALVSLTLTDLLFALPFSIWLLTGYFRSFPDELIGAARIDGATTWQLFRFVLIPVMAPVFVPTGLLAFISVWNEYLFALVFTAIKSDARPVTVAMAIGGIGYGPLMAMTVLLTIFVLLLALIFQQRLIAGLTSSTRKA